MWIRNLKIQRFLIIFTAALCITVPARAAYMSPVTVDGRDWLQPIDFINTSWNDVAAVCDAASGACNGSLNGDDLTGWTWASVEDTNYLFDYFRDNYPGTQLAAYAVFNIAKFEPTFEYYAPGEGWVNLTGITRTMAGPGRADVGDVQWASSFGYNLSYLSAPGFYSLDTSLELDSTGHFFFRGPAFGVPAPSTLAIVALALLPLLRRSAARPGKA